MRRRTLTGLAAGAVLAVVAGGCSSEEPQDSDRIVLTPASEGAGHTHAPGQEHGDAAPIGDGTEESAGGYTLDGVHLPTATGGPGEMSFRILDRAGTPVTEYVEEQTKLLHLYVVREDLSGFRHVHPTLGQDGTWRAQVDLGAAGPWRVIAEFTPTGVDRPVILGTTVRVPGAWKRVSVPRGDGTEVADDGVLRVAADGGAATGDQGRLRLVVSTLDRRPVTLGSYLGASAHLTGFAVDSGRVVHLHPYGAAEQTGDGTVLTFHTTFTDPGDYRLFLQVRVDGLLHTVPVTVTVS